MKRYIPQHAGKQKQITAGRMIAVSICLITAIATLTVGITLAKMVSTAGGSDSAQVAAFIVEADGTKGEKLYIDCNTEAVTASCNFSVTNAKDGHVSEVSMKYDVIITLPEALPETITLSVGDGNGTVSESKASTDRKTFTFANMGRFEVGQEDTRSYTLTFTADADSVMQDYMFKDIIISVRAEQID